jgi:hypothetical protein
MSVPHEEGIKIMPVSRKRKKAKPADEKQTIVNEHGEELDRMIMGVTDPNIEVVHLNGNYLDCRKENMVLRPKEESK